MGGHSGWWRSLGVGAARVHHEVTALVEHLAADEAGEGPVAAVGLHMGLKVAPLDEALVALGAPEGPVARVDA